MNSGLDERRFDFLCTVIDEKRLVQCVQLRRIRLLELYYGNQTVIEQSLLNESGGFFGVLPAHA